MINYDASAVILYDSLMALVQISLVKATSLPHLWRHQCPSRQRHRHHPCRW